jgi:putative transposase
VRRHKTLFVGMVIWCINNQLKMQQILNINSCVIYHFKAPTVRRQIALSVGHGYRETIKKNKLQRSGVIIRFIILHKKTIMPQSLVKNYIHITFSTKNRLPLIQDSIKDELFNYLGGTCKELESHPIIVGGVNNHVHLLVNLSRKMALMNLIEKLKTHSSKWIKTKGLNFSNFYWQHGYGSFSVNPKQIDIVARYIENQEAHHKKISFQDEYRKFLKENQMEYDERYVWD